MSLLPEVAKEEADGEWRDFSRTWVMGGFYFFLHFFFFIIQIVYNIGIISTFRGKGYKELGLAGGW